MRKSLFTGLFVLTSVVGAGAVDVKELLPCKPAALRYCDRTGITMRDLLKCATTLASVSDRIGNQCKQVLRRYGQL